MAISNLPSVENCDPIIDLGCGVGNFAKMLIEAGYTNYLGIDFSLTVINNAKKQVPGCTFLLMDLRNKKSRTIFRNYKIFIALETFEHIKNDLEVIKDIPFGILLIFSVPTFDSKFHVRYFKTVDDVIDRFGHFLDFKDDCIKIRKTIFLFRCIRKHEEY